MNRSAVRRSASFVASVPSRLAPRVSRLAGQPHKNTREWFIRRFDSPSDSTRHTATRTAMALATSARVHARWTRGQRACGTATTIARVDDDDDDDDDATHRAR